MLVLETSESVVMDVSGWSKESMLAPRCQHVVDELRREAASRIAGLSLPSAEPGRPQPMTPVLLPNKLPSDVRRPPTPPACRLTSGLGSRRSGSTREPSDY